MDAIEAVGSELQDACDQISQTKTQTSRYITKQLKN